MVELARRAILSKSVQGATEILKQVADEHERAQILQQSTEAKLDAEAAVGDGIEPYEKMCYLLGLIYAKRNTDRSRRKAVQLWTKARLKSQLDTGEFCRWGEIWFAEVKARTAETDEERTAAMYRVGLAVHEGKTVVADPSLAGVLFPQVFPTLNEAHPDFKDGREIFVGMLRTGTGIQKNTELALGKLPE
jgi:hypothetical protein